MPKPTVIWVLGDGKPGHENQSLGLAEAMARRVDCEVHRIGLVGGWFWKRGRMAMKLAESLPKPDWILGAGHATHWPLLCLSRHWKARSVVLMKPSLPVSWFDRCIAPRHDFPEGYSNECVIPTHGALHRMTPGKQERKGGLILVGGAPKGQPLSGGELEKMIAEIRSEGEWIVGDSRRSPDGWLEGLQGKWPNVELVSHRDTGPDWVCERMQRASEIWVTEDSVSMVCEAAASGARVGVLPLPGVKPRERVNRGINSLVADGYVTRYESWRTARCLPEAKGPLLEADRCAEILLGG